MKRRIVLSFISLFLVMTAGQADKPALTDLTDWHVDAINGDDKNGIGSTERPFKSIRALLAVNDVFPDLVGEGDTIYLASGNYDAKSIVIESPQYERDRKWQNKNKQTRPNSRGGCLCLPRATTALLFGRAEPAIRTPHPRD